MTDSCDISTDSSVVLKHSYLKNNTHIRLVATLAIFLEVLGLSFLFEECLSAIILHRDKKKLHYYSQ